MRIAQGAAQRNPGASFPKNVRVPEGRDEVLIETVSCTWNRSGTSTLRKLQQPAATKSRANRIESLAIASL